MPGRRLQVHALHAAQPPPRRRHGNPLHLGRRALPLHVAAGHGVRLAGADVPQLPRGDRTGDGAVSGDGQTAAYLPQQGEKVLKFSGFQNL